MLVHLERVITYKSSLKISVMGDHEPIHCLKQISSSSLPFSRNQQVSEQEVTSRKTNVGRMCTEKSQRESLWIKLIKKQT